MQCGRPGRSLIRNIRHQQRQQPWLAPRHPVLDDPAVARHLRKLMPLAEVAQQFHLWILTQLRPAIQLQKIPVIIKHRRIALLHLQHARSQRPHLTFEPRTADPHQFARSAAQTFLPSNDLQQCRTDRLILQGVMQYILAIHWQKISLGRRSNIIHLEQNQMCGVTQRQSLQHL